MIDAADGKGFNEGTAEATRHYKKQVAGSKTKVAGSVTYLA